MCAVALAGTGLGASQASAANGFKFELGGATGGQFRFPNTNQDKDAGNAFLSGWVKLHAEIFKRGDTRIRLETIGSYGRDSAPFAWNNATRLSFGATVSTRVGDHLSVTFAVRHEIYDEISGAKTEQGTYANLSYYYFRNWKEEEVVTLFGLRRKGAHLKSYGGIKGPGSLKKGDDNVVVNIGAEYAVEYAAPGGKVTFSPYANLHLTWDKDGNNYNTKVRPALGARWKYKLKKGSLYAGLQYEVDYRPVEGSTKHGPQIMAGWYKSF